MVDRDAATGLTLLKSAAGIRLTKLWKADGSVDGYEDAKTFTVATMPASGIDELASLLDRAAKRSDVCSVHGVLKDGAPVDDKGRVHRLKEHFEDVPKHALLIDSDKYAPLMYDPVMEPGEAIAEFIEAHLPAELQGRSFYWQLSSSAGHARNAGVLKAHIWFWMDTPRTCAELTRWAREVGECIDKTVYRVVQVRYTALPLFEDGVADPVPVRSGLVRGAAGDTVELVIPEGGDVVAPGAGEGREYPDARAKPGLIGAFCRAYTMDEVWEEYLGGQYVRVAGSDRRVTWLNGGGSAEGCFVDVSQEWLVNTHNTSPNEDRAMNKWDLVRIHLFGDRDTPDVVRDTFDVTALPSHQAMVALAREDERVQEELGRGEVVRAVETAEAVTDYRGSLAGAGSEAALREVALRIAADRSLDPLARDLLAGVLRDRLGEVVGVRPRIEVVRQMLVGRGAEAAGVAAAPWLDRWVFVTDRDKFFNLDTKEIASKTGFDAKFNRELGEDGESASDAAINLLGVPVVARLLYVPWLDDIFDVDGLSHANLYRKASVPVGRAVGAWSDEERAAIGRLERHLELAIPVAEYRRVYVQWMAWQVQNPGIKVLWAPCLQGVEGDGKTIIASMLSAAMGAENVGTLSSMTLTESAFTGWAMGRAVLVIEEIKLDGHNRFDATNKLKPLITNARIEIHPKGREPFTTLNTCNYMIFTNHKGAIPLDDKDRRYMVLFSPWASIEEFHEAVGGDPEAYWDAIYAVLQGRADLVRGWLESIDLSDFNPHARAPATEFKDEMVARSMGDEVLAVLNVIEAGGVGFSRDIISSAHLSKALYVAGVTLRGMALHRTLEQLKFSYRPKPIKWAGNTVRVWTRERRPLSTDELRCLLDMTTFDADFLS